MCRFAFPSGQGTYWRRRCMWTQRKYHEHANSRIPWQTRRRRTVQTWLLGKYEIMSNYRMHECTHPAANSVSNISEVASLSDSDAHLCVIIRKVIQDIFLMRWGPNSPYRTSCWTYNLQQICLLKVWRDHRDIRILARQSIIKSITIVLITFVENIEILGWPSSSSSSSSSSLSLRGTRLFVLHTFSPSFPRSSWISASFWFHCKICFGILSSVISSKSFIRILFVFIYFMIYALCFRFFCDIFILNTIQCSAAS
jgi:hypothetical protein